MKPVIVVGAGWSGAVVANRLAEAGVNVDVLEKSQVVGGHSRVETLDGVVYEPNGPHILHTNDERVAGFFERLGLAKHPYRHQPLAEIETPDGRLHVMSWPIQLDEVETMLPDVWPRVKAELEQLPARPTGANLEDYVVSLMGETLYRLFIHDYTVKQWGREPSELSSSFAPKRIEMRRDGDRNLFKDRWEWWPPNGVNSAIEQLIRTPRVSLTVGDEIVAEDLYHVEASAFVVTAPLDVFAYGGPADRPGAELAWRGVRTVSRFHATEAEQTLTPAYVVNRNHNRVPYTRTVEAKHASGQFVAGTVVSEEYPGADARHYPVDDVGGQNRRRNAELQREVRRLLLPVPTFFCGRLATYRYINQDEAVLDAWECADAVLATLSDGSE